MLRLVEIEKPIPKDDEVLINVRATTVNRTDTGFRQGEYLAVRLVSGLLRPRRKILGSELAGVVEAVGAHVTKFRAGDRVFGLHTLRFGAHAEYVCVREGGSIAAMPASLTFGQAAAVCDGLMLANNYIRRIDFKKGTSILVNGASGSIGSAAVQLARYYGAEVTATCKTTAVGSVKSLGVDAVLDYTKEDFTRLDRTFDVVLDSVGKSTFFKCRKLLKPRGTYFSSELGPYWQNPFLAMLTPLLGGREVGFPIPTDSQEDILFFKKLIEEGKYQPRIDRMRGRRQGAPAAGDQAAAVFSLADTD